MIYVENMNPISRINDRCRFLFCEEYLFRMPDQNNLAVDGNLKRAEWALIQRSL